MIGLSNCKQSIVPNLLFTVNLFTFNYANQNLPKNGVIGKVTAKDVFTDKRTLQALHVAGGLAVGLLLGLIHCGSKRWS